MSTFASADVSALNRILAKLKANPELIHSQELVLLRGLIEACGGKLPSKPEEPAKHADPTPEPAPAAPKAAEPVESSSSDDEPEEPEPFKDEQDPDLWKDVGITGEDASYEAPTGDGDDDDAAQERAVNLKAEAQDLKNDGNFDAAIKKMTEALKIKTGSAMYWAFRSTIYLAAKKPNCAIADATRALEYNPDSARAMRTRGTAYRHLGNWEKASTELNAANNADFDDSSVALVKLCTEKAKAIRDWKRRKEIRAEEKRKKQLLKRQEELRKQREREMEEEAAEASSRRQAGGMPGGMPGGMGGMPGGMPGGPGGMGGMPPGMAEMFSDPEIQAAMQDPDVANALSQLMTNPGAAMQYMADPKVGPILQKIIGKMGGGMGGGGGGMPGGMPGGMGGMPGGMPGGMGGGRGGGMGGMFGGGRGGAGGGGAAPRAAPKPAARNDDLD